MQTVMDLTLTPAGLRPSNATAEPPFIPADECDAAAFMAAWCDRCANDHATDEIKMCSARCDFMACREVPPEWVMRRCDQLGDKYPTCTNFKPHGGGK